MSKSVLLIDDEWMIQQAVKARLTACGFAVTVAGDGPAGLEEARNGRPDVVLLDVRMPDMDGFEVLRQLRADPTTAGIPVIFLTANVQDSTRQEARNAGAAGFLSKPYEARQVMDMILAATEPASQGGKV